MNGGKKSNEIRIEKKKSYKQFSFLPFFLPSFLSSFVSSFLSTNIYSASTLHQTRSENTYVNTHLLLRHSQATRKETYEHIH